MTFLEKMPADRTGRNNAMLITYRSFTTKRKVSGILTVLLLISSLIWISIRQMVYSDGLVQTEGLRDDKIKQPEIPGQVPTEPSPKPLLPVEEFSNIRDIQNATLGFQKIFVLSMPQRRDKRDSLTISAYLSGLEIEFVDGVNGSQISDRERPDNWENAFNTDGSENVESSLGCWRGHMDIYQKMIRERIETALIMEDDVDWDVMIKSQMHEIALGSKHLQHAEGGETTHSPYGDDWFLISTGHCGIYIDTKKDQEHWVIDNDPTVLGWKQRQTLNGPDTSPKQISGLHTRLIFGLRGVVCSGSYAISLKGVTGLLYDQNVLPNAKPIDLALSHWCNSETQGHGKCLGVHPPITGTFVPSGDRSKESDRQHIAGPKNAVAWAKNMVYSTRLNMGGLLVGNTTVKSQYPNETMLRDINMATLELPTGNLVLITKEEYAEYEAKRPKSKEGHQTNTTIPRTIRPADDP